MGSAGTFAVNAGWRILLADLGVDAGKVLRRAGLPGDLFARDNASLDTSEYFRLWEGLEEEAADPTLPIRIGSAIPVETFDPPIFAALCSPDLGAALERIARYKRLIMPMALHLDASDRGTRVDLEWIDKTLAPPVSLVATELVFFVSLARLATRCPIRPLEVRAPRPPQPAADYAAHFGVRIEPGPMPSITFSAVDATRPFVTANEKMWQFFEPALQKRLSELDRSASMAERVRATLLELLPSGRGSMPDVAARLGLGTRTLQRRLGEEGVSFQRVVNRTREELATHYLRHTAMSGAEISFLLGFQDPNSFFRAFHAWTGRTPEGIRAALRGAR